MREIRPSGSEGGVRFQSSLLPYREKSGSLTPAPRSSLTGYDRQMFRASETVDPSYLEPSALGS
jgi:hypothetical protein